MMIEKHKTVGSVAKCLLGMNDWRWLRAIPGDILVMLLAPVVKVAEWIVAERRDLLDNDELTLAVAGTPLDSFESGAMWSTLAPMLGKQPGWVTGSVQVNGGPLMGSTGAVPLAPAYASTRIGVARVPEDIDGLARLVNQRTALIVSMIGSPLAPSCVLCSGRSQVDDFFKRGGSLVALAQSEQDAFVMSGGASALGLAYGMSKSRFTGKGIEAGLGWHFWQTGPIKKPVADERAKSYAEFTAAVVETLQSMRNPLKDIADDDVHEADEDVVSWGVSGLLQSSVDASDTYITLPRTFALRTLTSTVVRVEGGLVTCEMGIRVDPRALTAYKELGDSWIERAGWAATVWNGGLGKIIGNTLMGHMQQLGMRVGTSSFKTTLKEVMEGSGLDKQTIDLLSDAVIGGEPYAPSQGERRAHDLARRGKLEELWTLIEDDPRLANARNERREPLINVLAQRGSAADLHKLQALGADVNANDGGGRPVLTAVASWAPLASVKALIELGAGVNVPDPIRWTPLLLALKWGRWDVAGLLVDCGADVHWQGADSVSAIGFVRGDKGVLDELDRMAETIDSMSERMGLPRLNEVLKRNGMIAEPQQVPGWLVDKVLAAA